MQRIIFSIFFTITVLVYGIYSEAKIGSKFSVTEFLDQYDKKQYLNESTKLILFGNDMSSGKIGKEALEPKEEGFLQKHKIIYISDIHQMPFFISKWVALPKMKKYKFPIALIQDDTSGSIYPFKKDHITLIHLDQLEIKNVQYASNTQELNDLLERFVKK